MVPETLYTHMRTILVRPIGIDRYSYVHYMSIVLDKIRYLQIVWLHLVKPQNDARYIQTQTKNTA